jgi:hypothetical protein
MRKTIVSVLLAGSLAAGGAIAASSTMSAGASTSTSATTSAKASIAGHTNHPRLRRAIRRAVIRISAHTIGIQPADLVTDLKAGQSIADVANAHNVQPQTVVDALVKAGDNALEKLVANHKITRARANNIEARLPALATKIVNKHFK